MRLAGLVRPLRPSAGTPPLRESCRTQADVSGQFFKEFDMKKTMAGLLSLAAVLVMSIGVSFAGAKTGCCPGGSCCKSGSCCRTHHHAK